MSQPFDEIAELREDADVLLQQVTSVQGRMKPVKAEDSTGQIGVRLDASGQLQDVQVGFTWEQALSRDQLPAAILEALAAARVARFEDWGTSAREVDEEPRARARPTDDARGLVDTVKEQIASGAARDAGEFVEGLLADLTDGLREANQALDDHLTRQYTGRSTAGHVTARAVGNGDVQVIEFDQSWLAGAHPTNIGREATQAINAASLTSQREGLTAAVRATKLARVADLALPTQPTVHRP